MPVEQLREDVGVSKRGLTLALTRLQDAEAIEVGSDGVVHSTEMSDDHAATARGAVDIEERRRQFEASRFEMMRGYAETKGCRRRFLLTYFGENYDPRLWQVRQLRVRGPDRVRSAGDESPFPASSRVRHVQWGEGQVLRVEGDRLVVLFDKVGYKTLSVALAEENALL